MSQLPVIFLAFANEKVDDGVYLDNLPKEMETIRQALYSAKNSGLCEVVERANATIDHVVSVFQEPEYRNRIAIFHYGGHASGDMLMFESADGGVAAGSSEGLVPFLARQHSLQLVFINGCSSEVQALEMVEAGIPAVVGTTQAINDTVANQLASRFYKGIAAGGTLEKCWQDATDQAIMGTSKGNYRGLRKKESKENEAQFPWILHIREGADKVKNWNLPQASGDPLFGLPPIPTRYNLPEEPFLFFRRYSRPEAEVFFGRAPYIRDLYQRVVDRNSPPLVLLYGQSGVGKSSLFDAGLRPRLEETHEVIYLRRNPQTGLLQTLLSGIVNLEEAVSDSPQRETRTTETLSRIKGPLQELVDNIEETLSEIGTETSLETQVYLNQLKAMKLHGSEMLSDLDQKAGGFETTSPAVKLALFPQKEGLLYQWLSREAQTGRPLVIILDQVEEAFTRPIRTGQDELDEFFPVLGESFREARTLPMGKLILGYRKEYHPEIDDACKQHLIPRSQVFLEPLKKEDVMEVVNGLTSTERLRERYQLEVENVLPRTMATDLVEDPDSPVAPILQILVTKMWQQAKELNVSQPVFTEQLYFRLKENGILLQDFFEQQMATLNRVLPNEVSSGLVLDFLNFHTTRLGTAGSRDLESLRKAYTHREEAINQLIAKCKELYLLTDTSNRGTGLTHDTLAPLVIKAFRESDRPGQRAIRILENKMVDFETSDEVTLDPADLALVEKGEVGMRTWALREQELVKVSRIRREKEEAAGKRRRIFAIAAVALIALMGIISFLLKLDADQSKNQAITDRVRADSARLAAIRSDSLTHIANDSTARAHQRTLLTQDSLKISDSLKGVERNHALNQARIANAGKLVMESRLFLSESNQKEALRSAATGYRKDPTPEAHASLLEAYYFSPLSSSLAKFPDRINDLVVDKTNGNVVIATEGNEVIWLDKNGKEMGRQSHNAPVTALTLQNGVVISASEDGSVIRWELRSGKATRSHTLGNTLTAAATSRDGKQIALVNGDSVHIVNSNFDFLGSFSFSGSRFQAITFSPDERFLAIGDNKGKTTICDVKGEVEETFFTTEASINDLMYTKDGRWLAVGYESGDATIFKVDGSETITFTGPKTAVNRVEFIENDTYVAVGYSDRSIRISDMAGNLILELGGRQRSDNNGFLHALDYDAQTQTLYTGYSDGSVRSWDIGPWLLHVLASGSAAGTLAGWAGKKAIFYPQSAGIKAARIWQNGKKRVHTNGKEVRLGGISSGNQQLLTSSERMQSLGAITTAPTYCAVGGRKGVHIWDLKGNSLGFKSVGKEVVSHLTASGNGRYLVASTEKANLFIWDIRNVNDISNSFSDIEGFAHAFHPNHPKMLVSNGSTATEYAIHDPKSTSSFFQETPITCADYSPNGKLIATGSRQGTWHIWYKSGKNFLPLFSHQAHKENITRIAFSPDGKYLVTSSSDHTIKVWPIDPEILLKHTAL